MYGQSELKKECWLSGTIIRGTQITTLKRLNAWIRRGRHAHNITKATRHLKPGSPEAPKAGRYTRFARAPASGEQRFSDSPEPRRERRTHLRLIRGLPRAGDVFFRLTRGHSGRRSGVCQPRPTTPDLSRAHLMHPVLHLLRYGHPSQQRTI